ncbi:hypothetical protein MAH1_35170 [Sessilibacter sp. MAH1]
MKLSSEKIFSSSRCERDFISLEHPRLKSLKYTGNDIYINEYRDVFLVQSGNTKDIVNSIEELKHKYPDIDVLKISKLSGLTLNVVAPGAALFSHWLFDSLSKFALLKHAGLSISDFNSIIFNSISQEFHKETLSKLNIENINVVERNDGNEFLYVEHLIDFTDIRNRFGTHDWQVEYLFNLFYDRRTWSLAEKKDKLFIERVNGSRSIINFDKFRDQIEQLGFKFIRFESLSVSQALSEMSNVKVLAGPHGAGFSNAIFGGPDLKVLEIFSRHISPEFFLNCYIRSQSHLFLEEMDSNGKKWYEQNLDYVNNFVEINSEKILLSNASIKALKAI